MIYILEKTFHFDSAHQLAESDYLTTEKCMNLHGHRWQVHVKVSISESLKGDMVVDFSSLKEIFEEVDHKNLNDLFIFNPTAENLAIYFYDKVMWLLCDKLGYKTPLVEITIEESPGAKVTYKI